MKQQKYQNNETTKIMEQQKYQSAFWLQNPRLLGCRLMNIATNTL